MAAGVVEAPIPRFPLRLKRSAVEVAVPPVDVEMVKSGESTEGTVLPAMERVPHGELVPTPTLP